MNSSYAESFKIIGGDNYKVRFFNNENNFTHKFLIQTYNLATNEVSVYVFLHNQITDEWEDSINKVTMPSKSVALQYSKFKLSFGCTFLKNYVIMFNTESELCLLDYEINEKVFHKQLERLNIFNDDLVLDITEVEDTDDFIVTYKQRCLTRLNHGLVSAFKTVGQALYVEVLTDDDKSVHANTWSVDGDSYCVKKNIFCVQFNRKQCFKFYDLNACKEKKDFKENFSFISFHDKSLLYGFSPDCKFFYTFEYENEFNFYDVLRSTRLISVPMFHTVYSINLTNKFVTMVLDNGALFSCAICKETPEIDQK